MVVSVDAIREGGLTLDEPLSRAFLAEALHGVVDTGFSPAGGAVFRVQLRRLGGGVLVRGQTELAVETPCKRCLSPVTLKLPVQFTLNLVPRDLARGDATGGAADEDEAAARAGSFELTRPDEETFTGKTIDLDPIVREQILLALPMDAVCREDCKGLCGMCGQNLNDAACGCEAKVVDPRLAALKNIKLN